MEQDNHTTAAGVRVDHDAHAGLLQDLLARIAPCFAETRLTCSNMVRGLLMELEDHNCWSIAEAVGHQSPSRLQHLLARARCDEQQLLQAAADWAIGHLAAGHDVGDAVLIVDETSDVKSSTDCVGAARQYCGTAGGIALCQLAVLLISRAPFGQVQGPADQRMPAAGGIGQGHRHPPQQVRQQRGPGIIRYRDISDCRILIVSHNPS